MKVLAVLFALVLLGAAGQLKAQSVPDCAPPSWVSTVATESWMPTLCSTHTIHAFDAADGMREKDVSITVLGYWYSGYNNIPLVYAQTQYNPNQVWLLDRSAFQ